MGLSAKGSKWTLWTATSSTHAQYPNVSNCCKFLPMRVMVLTLETTPTNIDADVVLDDVMDGDGDVTDGNGDATGDNW